MTIYLKPVLNTLEMSMVNCFRYGMIGLSMLAANSTASATALLVKTTTPGYVMAESAMYNSCTLDDQGFLIVKSQIKGMTSRQAIPQQFSYASIKKAIAAAAKGKIKSPVVQIADAPTSNYYAYNKLATGKMAKVLLIEDGGLLEYSPRNESPSAKMLRSFMDAVCK
jgi:hypothetical protein